MLPTLGQKLEFCNRIGGEKEKKKKSRGRVNRQRLRTDARLLGSWQKAEVKLKQAAKEGRSKGSASETTMVSEGKT